jgi:hypothetical protein
MPRGRTGSVANDDASSRASANGPGMARPKVNCVIEAYLDERHAQIRKAQI